ncbi:amidohydrolase family protein [Neobacillus niacini]|uniref:amidohydrolase family protein n=1 Tax=Neobacillus niacini TaxID=86668 RepID=UPI002FFE8103
MIIDAWTQIIPVGNGGAMTRYVPELKGQEITAAIIVEEMDKNGVDKALVAGLDSIDHPTHTEYFAANEKVVKAIEKYPDRIIGVFHLNERESIMKNIQDMEHYVKNYGFKLLRFEPFRSRRNADDKFFYPFYAKACELDIAVQIQVGNTGNKYYPMENGRPFYVDRVAMDFPDLRLICGHIGWPWTAEMIAVAWRHPNVYIDTSAHTPKHFPDEFTHFLKTYGKDKCIFASDWPLLSYERLFKEFEQLNASEEVTNKFYSGNLIRALKL